MRKVVLLIVSLLICGLAMAQDTASLTIQGRVPSVLSIDIIDPLTTELDLTIAQNTYLAKLEYSCNDPDGFTIDVDSLNDFKLVNAVGGMNSELNYSINRETTAISELIPVINSNTSIDTTQNNLYIVYSGNDNLQPGLFTDTLTFTITSK